MAPCTSPQDLVRASCGLTTIGHRNRSHGGGVPVTEAAWLTIWYAMSVLEAVVLFMDGTRCVMSVMDA